MAKKIVRGVTGVENIESFDKTLTNVNDIISDGQHTYVHTKKGKNELYYKVTDGVTSVNSSGGTISVNKSVDGTDNLDTNPKKVLEHDNLLNDFGVSKKTSDKTSKIGIEYTPVQKGFDLNTLNNGRVRSGSFLNSPSENTWYFVSSFVEGEFAIQEAVTLLDSSNKTYRRYRNNGKWEHWREQVGDKSIIDGLLAQKQNTLTGSNSIGVVGSFLRQLYSSKQTYNVTGGLLKTHVKSIAQNTSVSINEEEFNFILKIDKGVSTVNFTLNEQNTTKFNNIMSAYGSNKTVIISDCVFTLSGSILTVSTTNNTNQNYVITFSDII